LLTTKDYVSAEDVKENFRGKKPAATSDDCSAFEFTSVGPRGKITKQVLFAPTSHERVFNLGFGDYNPGHQVNDKVVTDNGDRTKVLATIASIVNIYTSIYPDRWVYLEGSTPSRSRLYRIAIDSISKSYQGSIIFMAFSMGMSWNYSPKASLIIAF
jgi:hypothetical protein